jgi:HEAT repeat protein
LSSAVTAAMPSLRTFAQQPLSQANPADELDQLKATLFNTNKPPRERDEAAKRLLQRGANDILMEALQSNRSDLEVPVARALADVENPPPDFLNELMRTLQPTITPDLAEAVSLALAGYRDNPNARNRLREFIRRADVAEGARLAAVRSLGTWNDKETAQFLIELLLRGDTIRLSDAAADALAEMTGRTEYGRDVGQWEDWWRKQQDKNPREFIEERRAERESRFRQANDQLKQAIAVIERLVDDQHRAIHDEAEREAAVLRWLKDNNATVRAAGAKMVQQERAEGITVAETVKTQLRELIGDSSPDVRQKVAGAIRAINDSKAAKPLLAQLKREPFPAVKAALIDALAPTRDVGAVPDLLHLLDDASFQVSEAAGRALAELGPEIAKDPKMTRDVSNALVQTIGRTERLRGAIRLREQVVAAMIPLKDPDLVTTLFALLKEEEGNSPSLRRSAIKALSALNNTQRKSDIAIQLASGPLHDAEPGVRLEAAAALGIVGGPAQAEALYSATLPSREPDEKVRDEAWKSVSSLFQQPEFDALTLENWAGNRLNGMPDRLLTAYLALYDKYVKAGDDTSLAKTREDLGTLYLDPKIDKPESAIPYLRAALEFWDAKGKGKQGKGVRTVNLQTNLMDAYLRSKQYKEAAVFAKQRIQLDPGPNEELMGLVILQEVDRLEKRNELKSALELLTEAKGLSIRGQKGQQIDNRYNDISARNGAFREWYVNRWYEVVV